MVTINITISKVGSDIIIKTTEGKQIKISDSNKELKATEVIKLLNYDKNNVYKLEDLDSELLKDKSIVSVYTIFEEIVDKLNPVI